MNVADITERFRKKVSDAQPLGKDNEVPCENGLDIGKEFCNKKNSSFVSLTEAEAGITEYLNKNEGFQGVIKERFSDFQVHEIDLDGNIVTLSNFDMPVIPEPTDFQEDVINENVREQLNLLKEEKIEKVEIEESDKAKRKQIHKFFRSKYKTVFHCHTDVHGSNDEKRTIVITLSKGPSNSWPSDCGKYLHFVLFKVNLDTMDAVNQLAKALHTKPSNFTYAGTKDKRAKTSQKVSMWHLKPERLNSLNNCFKNIKVGNFSYEQEQLKLGDLKGNHFKIALRNVIADKEVIDTALKSFHENGFINYFGLQRFGNSREIPTFKIGKSLIKGEFNTAVELILKPRTEKFRNDGLEAARKIWWETKDAKKAYESLKSKDRTHEGKLLLGLATFGNKAYVNALDCIPRNVRLLYLHSYQSLLWNRIVSKRIQKFGSCVIEGDLIWIESEMDCKSNDDSDNVICDGKTSEPVRPISADEVSKYNIFDVVHPLPGYNVIYPNNLIRTWYEELLKEEGLTTEEFKQKVREYSLSGTYRNIVKKAKDLSWEILYYSNPEDDLILSDVDLIEQQVSKTGCERRGEFKAVVMNFSLDSSTYATMAIREVLKINTSSSFQASLNSYANKRRHEDEDENESKKVKK